MYYRLLQLLIGMGLLLSLWIVIPAPTFSLLPLGVAAPEISLGLMVLNAIAFYEQKLGFTTVHREGDPLRLAIVQRDMAMIYLCKNGYQDLGSPDSLRIQVNQIDQLYAEYQAKDESIIYPEGHLEQKPWGPKEFVVFDPAGCCLTFFEMP